MTEDRPNTGDDHSLDSLMRTWLKSQARLIPTLSIKVHEGVRVDDRGRPMPQTISPQGIPSEEAVGEPTITRLPELLIQATILTSGDATNEGQLVEGVAIPWFEILREVARDPNFLFNIDWRTLEEVIAGAYKREGWPQVELTPRSGDKGRDVIASKPGIGAIRIIDQVKAYKPGNKVPADDVRALLGVLTRETNVSKGVITTTSTFAPGVEAEMKAIIPNRLELKDGMKLREWLTRLMPK
jgi:restriction system protein